MPVKILIADDEPNQLELLSYNLVQAGFDVAQAHDGQAAMTMIEDWHPDLVVLDWMMPHMSGIELCRILRSRTDTKLLPIIILSARGEEGDRTLGLDTGADDYMSKPFSPRELVSRVKALLRRSRPALMNDVLEFEDLQLFQAGWKCFVAAFGWRLGQRNISFCRS
jgi:two-component system phosphate regulon response regulator PhoB